MRKRKARLKVSPYNSRNQRKMFRSIPQKEKSRIYIRNRNATIEDDFLGNDYNRVIEHLDRKKQKEYMNSSWNEEMIYTVFALQEGISRLRDKNIEGYEGRGSGTVSMIEMFNDLGESQNGLKPQMTIVSGNTQIRFTDDYKMQPVKFKEDKVFETGEKQIIAFNDENNIYAPANPQNVSKINQFFPGTVISLKFYLDSRYISNRKKENR